MPQLILTSTILYVIESAIMQPPMPVNLTKEDVKNAKPVLTQDERAAVLKAIDDAYVSLGYHEDEIIKLPLKHIVKASQVASEATFSACMKYLSDVPDSLKAYITQNVLPEDYKHEVAISREINRLTTEVKMLKLELDSIKELMNQMLPGEPDEPVSTN